MKRFLFLLVLSLPIRVFADGGLPEKPYIYVEGNAEIQKPADFVTLRFDLVARAPEQPKANQEVQAKANKIFPLLKGLKIADTDVIAEDLRSEPEFEEGPEYSTKRGKFIGYKVTRPFKVKVRDVTVFPKLADELIGGGGVEFSGIEGGLSKEKEKQIEADLWQKALTSAREKAETTLKALNMKIDSVFAVSPVGFLEIQRGIFESGVPAQEAERVITPSEYRLAPITISQSVHVIYLISPAK
jgi:uncharacterized protein YggE